MLGLSASLSWGQSGNPGGDANNVDPEKNCSSNASSVITDPSSGQTVSAPTNGVIWGDSPGNFGPASPGGWKNGTASFHLFDGIVTQTCTDSIGGSTSWFAQIASLMQYTFRVLAVLELCWAAALWAFEKEHLNSLAAEMIKKIMFIGFFYTLLQYGQEWIPAIPKTFSNLGTQVTHVQASTDGIIAQGLAEIDFIWKNEPTMTIGNWTAVLPKYALAALITIVIILAAIVLAAQYFMAQVEGYIMLAVGAVFLGLGANSFTQEYVKKTLDYSVVVGVRLLTIILIAALVQDAIQTSISDGWSFDMQPLARMGAVSLMQLMMALRAPEMSAALMSGGSGLTAAAAGAVGGPGTSIATKTVGAAAGQGAGVLGGATNLMKAALAGTEIARQGGKSGMSAVVSGLGKAVTASMKSAPAGLAHKLQNALSSDERHQHNSSPGAFSMAKAKLREQAAKGREGDGSGSSGGGANKGPGAAATKGIAAGGAGQSASPRDHRAPAPGEGLAEETFGLVASAPSSPGPDSSASPSSPPPSYRIRRSSMASDAAATAAAPDNSSTALNGATGSSGDA